MSRKFLLSASMLALAAGAAVSAGGRVSAQAFVGTPTPPQFAGQGQPSTKNGEWPTSGADVKFTRYSPLDQIRATSRLQQARSGVAASRPTPSGPIRNTSSKARPIMVKGVLYTSAEHAALGVVAIDAKTGELIWSHSLREGQRAANSARQLSGGAGFPYWTDGRGDDRIIYAHDRLPPGRARCQDRRGRSRASPDKEHPRSQGRRQEGQQRADRSRTRRDRHPRGADRDHRRHGDRRLLHARRRDRSDAQQHQGSGAGAPSTCAERQAAVALRHHFRAPASSATRRGRTTIPWVENGNNGVWTQITVDEELGLVYLPVETPTNDYYGGHRLGNNLFAESLVALDLKTGQRKWHFQFVHHPIWNWDMTSAPILSDINVNGRAVKAVSVASTRRAGCMYSTASPASRCGRSSRSPCLNPMCRARRPPRLSPSRRTALSAVRPQLPQDAGRPDGFPRRSCGRRRSTISSATRWWNRRLRPACSATRRTPSGRSSPAPRRTGRRLRLRPGHPHRLHAGRQYGQPCGRWCSRPGEFSDIRYVQGIRRPAVSARSLAPGELLCRRRPADRGYGRASRAPTPARRQRAAACRQVRQLERRGAADLEAALRRACRYRPRQGPAQVAGSRFHGDTPDQVRNHAALKDMNIPKTGQALTSGVGRPSPQDAGDHGRPDHDHDAGTPARRHAARL